LHASVDKRYKLMRKMVVTHAVVADTTVFQPLLDRANTSRDVYCAPSRVMAPRPFRLRPLAHDKRRLPTARPTAHTVAAPKQNQMPINF
jgi:hypothetical protein